ncbi:uncharacterized protein FOMMEDRAFT_170339 [Fomitiporia mediterranea MF3/22]|uniref:uncharacterized protein n=1 Tax=Fomitiporia mediterranea (strain MF3/22) TaxID=694068 RepID=UPI00044079B0|nr:uncharacterized protein FOMMEDRAFT_170339 [Fomitiporia mediterranea MF3/22]EJC99753.1 hypothetical protein FOMMEDRAFT_170339 [Fomitiporia mediterranea MF3/22]
MMSIFDQTRYQNCLAYCASSVYSIYAPPPGYKKTTLENVCCAVGLASAIMAIGLDEASLLALVMESIMFGLLTACFSTTTYILLFRRRHGNALNKPVFAVSVLMYCVAFTHIALNARRAVYAFIALPGGHESTVAYFKASADPLYLAKISMYIIQTITGDAFIIYRLYMVWGRELRLLIPALIFLFAGTACAIMAAIDASLVSPTTLIFIPRLKQWIVSFFSLTLFTNASCTALIAFKIWWTGRQLGRASHRRNLTPVMAIIIESGSVYSISLISLMCAYLSGTWGHYIVLDMMTPIIAITFSLIIVRIGLGISASNASTRFRSTSQGRNVSLGSRGAIQEQMPMQPLVVHLAQTRSVKDDAGKLVTEGGETDSFGTQMAPPRSKHSGGESFVDV